MVKLVLHGTIYAYSDSISPNYLFKFSNVGEGEKNFGSGMVTPVSTSIYETADGKKDTLRVDNTAENYYYSIKFNASVSDEESNTYGTDL